MVPPVVVVSTVEGDEQLAKPIRCVIERDVDDTGDRATRPRHRSERAAADGAGGFLLFR